MADIDFPEEINRPEQSTFTRTQAEGFSTSEPSSGDYFYVIETEDLPTVYNLSFEFSQDDSIIFETWLRDNLDVKFGAKFNMTLYEVGTPRVQEVSFTQGGTPQLTGVRSVYNVYSAQVLARRRLSGLPEARETLAFNSRLYPIIVSEDYFEQPTIAVNSVQQLQAIRDNFAQPTIGILGAVRNTVVIEESITGDAFAQPQIGILGAARNTVVIREGVSEDEDAFAQPTIGVLGAVRNTIVITHSQDWDSDFSQPTIGILGAERITQ